ncbi:MAG: DUF4249 family protein [Flavobacteriaceae bacterium]
MKSFKYLFYLFLIIACEEVVEIDLKNTNPALVVDGLIKVSKENNSIESGIILSKTNGFYDSTVEYVDNATVRIIDNVQNSSYEITQSRPEARPGVYDSGFPEFQVDEEYELQIIYEGEEYSSTATYVPTATIDNIEISRVDVLNEERTRVILNLANPPKERNFYLANFFGNLEVIQDEFYENQEVAYPYFFEEESFTGLKVQVFGIDRNFFIYLTQLIDQSADDENSRGNPFGTPPSELIGNIRNNTRPSKQVYGYFSISQFDAEIIEFSSE